MSSSRSSDLLTGAKVMALAAWKLVGSQLTEVDL